MSFHGSSRKLSRLRPPPRATHQSQLRSAGRSRSPACLDQGGSCRRRLPVGDLGYASGCRMTRSGSAAGSYSKCRLRRDQSRGRLHHRPHEQQSDRPDRALGREAPTWITVSTDETTSLRCYTDTFADRAVLLLDTYDTVTVGTRIAASGRECKVIRGRFSEKFRLRCR